MHVYLVPIIPPPLVLSVQGDSIPNMTGLYYLSNSTYNGYPSYHGSQGCIAVQGNKKRRRYEDHLWYWKSNKTDAKIEISSAVPASYTPVGWHGWDVEEQKNKMLVSPNVPFCSTDYGGYFISKSYPQFCNKKPDCNNNADEKDCPEIDIVGSIFITIGIVLVGMGLFLILRYSHMMDIHRTNITMSRTKNIDENDAIIDYITLGRLSNI